MAKTSKVRIRRQWRRDDLLKVARAGELEVLVLGPEVVETVQQQELFMKRREELIVAMVEAIQDAVERTPGADGGECCSLEASTPDGAYGPQILISDGHKPMGPALRLVGGEGEEKNPLHG